MLSSIAVATAGWSAGPAAATHPSHASRDRKILSFAHRRARRGVFDRFNLCVANHEAGEPGSESPRTVDWHIVDPPYQGGFQWDPGTWAAAGGLRYGSEDS
jgi:hypothetical protein